MAPAADSSTPVPDAPADPAVDGVVPTDVAPAAPDTTTPPADPTPPAPPADTTPPAPTAPAGLCPICFPLGLPEGYETAGCEHSA